MYFVFPIDTHSIAEAQNNPSETSVSGFLKGSSPGQLPLTFAVEGSSGPLIYGSLGTIVLTNTATGAYIYTPNQYKNGTEILNYAVDDGKTTVGGTLTITITPVNSTPATMSGSLTMLENTVLDGTLNSNSFLFDPDAYTGRLLNFLKVVGPSKGTLVVNANGNFTYHPNANAYGDDTFTFEATDGVVYSNISTLTIHITHVNVAPVANDSSITLNENTVAGVQSSVTATDPDGDALTYSIQTAPLHGTLAGPDAATGLYTYIPTADYCGVDSFVFKVTDPGNLSSTGTVSIAVSCINDPPIISLNTGLSQLKIAGNDNFYIYLNIYPGNGADEMATQSVDISTIKYLTSNANIIRGSTSSFIAIPAVGVTDVNFVKTISYANHLLVLEVSPVALATGNVTLTFQCQDNLGISSGNYDVNLKILPLSATHGGWKNVKVLGRKIDKSGTVFEKSNVTLDWNAFALLGGGMTQTGWNIYKASDDGVFDYTSPLNQTIISPTTTTYTDYGISFDQASSINVASNSITFRKHNYITGDRVRVEHSGSTGNLPGNLSADTDYYVIKIDDNTFKLADTLVDAIVGTAISITNASTGTMLVTLPEKRIFYYAVRPVVQYDDTDSGVTTTITMTISTSENYSAFKVINPPDNMVFVNRWLVNQEICSLMGQTPDPANNFRCPYQGPGEVAVAGPLYYYDIGYDFFVDRFEASCPYTTESGKDCGQPYGCIGIGAPSASPSDGAVYYDRSTGNCYLMSPVTHTWKDANTAVLAGLGTYGGTDLVTKSVYPHLPPLVNIRQQFSNGICSARGSISISGTPYAPRLPRRKEQIAYSAWSQNIPDSIINTYEIGDGLDSSSKCNGDYANGLTSAFTDSDSVFLTNIFTISGTASSGIRSLMTGTPSLAGFGSGSIDYTSSSACQSRYGLYDVVGNVREWVSDRFRCSTAYVCDGVYNDGGVLQGLMLDANNNDMKWASGGPAVYKMGNANGPGDGTSEILGEWYIYDRPFAATHSATRWSVPVGLPFVDSLPPPAYYSYQSLIGLSSGISSSKLHSDYISVDADLITIATGSRGDVTTGGSYVDGDKAGRWNFRLYKADSYSVDTGFRCIYVP